jgi:hypothetical protein
MHDNTRTRRRSSGPRWPRIKLRDPASGLDRLLVRLGVLGLVAGPGFAVAAWFISHGHAQPAPAARRHRRRAARPDLAVVGAALFVKGAVAGFLRFWLARLCYEQQVQRTGWPRRATAAGG